jgi:dihydroorotase
MRYLIKNGSIIDPARRVATIGNVLVENGKVVQVIDLADLTIAPEPLDEHTEVINARGAVIAPGFLDLHAHVREPGEEQKETIETATKAAAAGGFTTLCVMPIRARLSTALRWRVRSVTLRGDAAWCASSRSARSPLDAPDRRLPRWRNSSKPDASVFLMRGNAVMDAAVMRNALAYAAMLDTPIMAHCEDVRLTRGWGMHDGAVGIRLGLPGYPAAAEEAMVARDIALAEMTGAHLHICHVSTAGSVALIRAAKARGVRVTAEVTPHHLTLTDRWVLGNLDVSHGEGKSGHRAGRERIDANEDGLDLPSRLKSTMLPPYHTSTRVKPPLRTEQDVEALIEGCGDGTIDAIASDHEPQSAVDKECEYRLAAPGISSLETALGLALTLVHRGKLDLVDLVAKFTEGPATVLGRAPSNPAPRFASGHRYF